MGWIQALQSAVYLLPSGQEMTQSMTCPLVPLDAHYQVLMLLDFLFCAFCRTKSASLHAYRSTQMYIFRGA